MEFRNLDGYYFRVERDGKWQNICFSDLRPNEREKVLSTRSEEFLKELCYGLGNKIREIGDNLDVYCE